MSEKAVRVLTFDIEEWFHLLDLEISRSVKNWDKFETRIHNNTIRILQLLNDKKQRATFFCLGWVCEKFPEVIKMIHDAGYEIGSHSMYHQLAYELSPQQFRDDLNRSIALIGEITGQKVRYYRVPGFSIKKTNAWVLEILVESGIEIDSSIFPAPRGHGGFEDFGSNTPVIIKTQSGKLKEFPINTSLFLGRRIVFSGGGYFRLLPYSILNNFMKKSSYVMSYFHPRDFDPEQPLLPGLNFNRRFKSYYGLSGALKKLSRIMNDFKFTDLSTAETMIDWFSRVWEPTMLSKGVMLQTQK